MYEGRKEQYKLSKPIIKDDGLGYQYVTYEEAGTVSAYLVLEDRSLYQGNDIQVYVTSLVAYTDEPLKEGHLLNNKYKVTKCLPHRTQYVLYLEEIENG